VPIINILCKKQSNRNGEPCIFDEALKMTSLTAIFTSIGGRFIAEPPMLANKVQQIKAFVFDWDGVFNDGTKNEQGSSNFSEVDSMGVNLLRFGWWLKNGSIPKTFIISGEKNELSFKLAKREHYDACYFKILNKIEALKHFMAQHNLQPHEVAFFFDDALDLSIAKACGVRVMVRHGGNPLFEKYVIDNQLVDYITGSLGGQFAVREGAELLLGLNNQHDAAITKRLEFRPDYEQYLSKRQQIETTFVTLTAGQFEPVAV
jgi:3-deoxy-D-manno-octulosonate 8-phosphate phosphatase (KDO 8-P phosphatase)